MIEPNAVLDAAERLSGIANRTPVVSSRTLDTTLGAHILFKCENFQRGGAFKFRGAYNALSRLSDEERRRGVITHSSGNHAQGVALAARLLGIKAVVVMPDDAPANKRAATEAYGAEIIACNALDREEVTAALIDQHGYVLVHPFDNDHIIAGQGTATLEFLDEVGELEWLFVPVGGGGLISGAALAAQLRSPGCRVVGVEPELGADANRSWHQGNIVRLAAVPETIADGLRTRAVGTRNFAVMRRYLHDMTTVTEAEIRSALAYAWERLKVVIEPSSAVALAPILTGRYKVGAGARVGVLLSGGNVDVAACGFLRQAPAATAEPVKSAARARKDDAAGRPSERAARTPRILLCAVPEEPAALAHLAEHADVELTGVLSEDELIGLIGQFQAVIVDSRQPLSSHVVKYGYNLKAIASLDSRLDNIDVSAARAMGIEVIFLPDNRAVAVAEHTIARLLELAERLAEGRLSGKTLGIVGFGQVGRLVAQRAAAFDMRVLVNQPRLTPELALSAGVELADLHELLARADFVTLHVPFSDETEAIVGREELARMKPSAMLVNLGHTDLVDDAALLDALQAGRIAGAAVSDLPAFIADPKPGAVALRRHPRVIVATHVTDVLERQQRDTMLEIARRVADVLGTRTTSESLELEVVPIELVVPHEHIDHKRVRALVGRLEEDGRLVNPPVTTFWKGRYVILDGATRYSALREIGVRYAIVQVVNQERAGFQLHTWYHAISSDERAGATFADLQEELERIAGLSLRPIPPDGARDALSDAAAICYFQDRDGALVLAELTGTTPRLRVMNAVVDTYTRWGRVERTLLTDNERLLVQFPGLVAVAVFPQFAPEDVFDAAAEGDLLPAGLTRFVIPGRILRLNADLQRLKLDEPLAAKRQWFDEFLRGKVARSRLRYYQEPVVLLDE